MSFIQKIRDKYARIAVIAIALALLGFILMDALVGRNQGFGSGPSSTVGKVNGIKIDVTDFETKVKQQEDFMQQQGYASPGEAGRQQAIEQVWTQEVNRILMEEEIDELGIDVGKKEINEILFGPNAPEDLKKQFTDPQTGQYDAAKAISTINQMKKQGTAEQKQSFNNYISQLELTRKVDKYNSLLSNSSNFPKWLIEKQIAENSLMAKISMVREVYSSIADSLIKISDKEIEDYIKKHKEEFKQEESRSIAYVLFSAVPSPADSAAARDRALVLKAEFDTTNDVAGFLARNGTPNYYSGYVGADRIQGPKDSIFKTPTGGVFGPYQDGANYSLAKVEGMRMLPDTVKVRHILIGFEKKDENGQVIETRDSVTAKRIIDSIRTVINNGQNFDSVTAMISEDPGSKDKGGVYDNIPRGQMVPEFNDFIFTNPTGAKGVVRTDFGYHYIEILSQKGSSMGYRVAYISQPIIVSQETDQNASNAANDFAGEARDLKSFDEQYEKKLKGRGIAKAVGTDIKRTAYDIPGIGTSRSFVRNIYNAKRGEVLTPEKVGDNYVVAIVTDTYSEGTQTVATARPAIEPLLRNKKKAEQIKQRIGKVTTLEAAAAALGNKPIDVVDSLRFDSRTMSTFGYEPRVIGASFNPANKGKVIPEPLEGINGIYVVRVDDMTNTPVADANVADLRRSRYEQAKGSAAYNIPNALKKAATIKDNRGKVY